MAGSINAKKRAVKTKQPSYLLGPNMPANKFLGDIHSSINELDKETQKENWCINKPFPEWIMEQLSGLWSEEIIAPNTIEWQIYQKCEIDELSGRYKCFSDFDDEFQSHLKICYKQKDRPNSWDRFGFLVPNDRNLLIRLNPISPDIADRCLLVKTKSDWLLMVTASSDGREFLLRLKSYLRLALFNDAFQNRRYSLRFDIEAALGIRRPEPDNPAICPRFRPAEITDKHILLHFDLVEWLRRGRKRMQEEAWKAHIATHRVLQPQAPPLPGRQYWRLKVRVGSPETLAWRIWLGILDNSEIPPFQTYEERYDVPEYGDERTAQAFNGWLWACRYMCNRVENNSRESLKSCIEKVRKEIIPLTNEALDKARTKSGNGAERIRGAWSRSAFAMRLLKSVSDNSIPGLGIDLEEEQRFFHNLALVVLDVLYERHREMQDEDHKGGEHPHLPCDPVEYTEALIYLIGVYSHHIVGIPYEIPIVPTLRRIFESEGIFYLVKSRYRNHLYHVLDVCMLGELLIERCALFKKIPRKSWWLTAFFHDVGYLAESIHYAPGFLSSLKGKVYQNAEKILKKSVDEVQDMVRKESEELEFPQPAFDHGVASGLHLWYLLQEVGLNPEDYSDVCKAISLHDGDEVRVSVQESPLAALLQLSDELQEWQRATVEIIDIRRRIASAVLYEEGSARWSNPVESISISVDDKRFSVEISYRDRAISDYDPIAIWMGKLKALERIRWPSNYNAVCAIETRSTWKSRPHSGMPTFRESIDNKEWLAPLRRFRDLQVRQEGIGHRIEKSYHGEIIEQFVVDLHKLPKDKWVIPRGSEAFRLLRRWREHG